MNRRSVLKVIGGGTVVAAVGVGANALRYPNAAAAPWGTAGVGYDDVRMNALSFAILAPNPHNMQPWKVALVGEDTVDLYVDQTRLLPHTDPFNRQITIGLGCFLEMLRMAAAETGQGVTITPFPEGEDAAGLDDRPVARVVFEGSAEPDRLFAYHQSRRSLKEPFDTTRAVPQSAVVEIVGAGGAQAGGTINQEDVEFWRDLTEQALMIETETPRTFQESVDVFRIGVTEINANPDGIDFSGPLFQTLATFGMFTRESAGDTSSAVYRAGLDAVVANTRSAMGHVWLVSDTNTRTEQIKIGAAWLRMNLAATALGVGFHPLSQAIQEYPEMEDIFAQTHDRLSPNGGTVQMLARIGYGPEVPPSPRWDIDAKLIT